MRILGGPGRSECRGFEPPPHSSSLSSCTPGKYQQREMGVGVEGGGGVRILGGPGRSECRGFEPPPRSSSLSSCTPGKYQQRDGGSGWRGGGNTGRTWPKRMLGVLNHHLTPVPSAPAPRGSTSRRCGRCATGGRRSGRPRSACPRRTRKLSGDQAITRCSGACWRS